MEVLPCGSKIHGSISMELIKTLPKVFEAALNQAITKSNLKEDSQEYHVSRIMFDQIYITSICLNYYIIVWQYLGNNE